MRPKTKVHFEVLKLHDKLPYITKEHADWAYDKLFEFYAYKTKHKAVCFECGHAWAEETSLIPIITGLDCPKCGKHLKMVQHKRWSVQETDHFQVITTYGGFQLIRMFHISHYCKKGYKAHYGCIEIYQHWISPVGKLVILDLNDNCMSSWQTGRTVWAWGSSMEIRGESDKYFQNDVEVYPKKSFIRNIYRNGFRRNYYGFNCGYFFHLLLSQPMFETLLKTKQIDMLKIYNSEKNLIVRYWKQINICIRNKYIIKNPRMWFDHIDVLQYFGKDLHRPKYICPDDLMRDHNRLINKRQAIINKGELDKIRGRIAQENAVYVQMMGKYFGLKFTNGEIDIIVLDSVMDFYMEGKKLHNCVYQNGYFKKKDSLILSARKEGMILETIEVSLQDFKIQQAYGAFHEFTPYHKDILALIRSNIDQIKQLVKPKKAKMTA